MPKTGVYYIAEVFVPGNGWTQIADGKLNTQCDTIEEARQRIEKESQTYHTWRIAKFEYSKTYIDSLTMVAFEQKRVKAVEWVTGKCHNTPGN